MKLSERLARLGTETAFEVLVRARALEAQGRNIVHLEIGEPDFDTPSHITDAAVAALKGGATHYGPSAGIPDLRLAIAEDSTARRGVKVTPEMVVVTPGGKPIMFYVILALIDPGDEVLYPNPGFPIYESMIRFIGGVPVPVRLLEEKGYALDVDQLDRQDHGEDEAHHPQLPAQPDGRESSPRRACARSPTPRCSTASPSSPTRSTRRSSTRASTSRSRPCRAWTRSRSSSTASRRPTR